MIMSDFVKLHRKDFSFKQFISNAIKEDVGDGDHTSLSIVPYKKRGSLHLLVKEEGIIAGVEAARRIFAYVDKKIRFNLLY